MSPNLFRLVKSWSSADISNESLFELSVTKIPKTFESLRQYFECFRIPLLEEIRNELHSCSEAIPSTKRTLTPYERIWKSIDYDLVASKRNTDILRLVLSPDYSVCSGHCRECELSRTKIEQVSEILPNLERFELNDSQLDAVTDSLKKRECGHKPSVSLIWGPPGTGKTKTTSALLWTMHYIKCRTLTCAPTNVAVVEVAKRVLRLVKESSKGEILALGDIVLFGNKDRMEIGDNKDLHDIFLEYRTRRLRKCFSPRIGWKHCLNCVKELLENGGLAYKTTRRRNRRKTIMSFMDFFKVSLGQVSDQLRGCHETLFRDLPRSYISCDNFEKLVALSESLKIIQMLLRSPRVDKDVEKLLICRNYLCPGVKDNESVFRRIQKTREYCLELVGELNGKLNLPCTSSKGSIENICLGNATLVFCTASSSWRLRRVKPKSLEVVVIDEAAQLKECESLIPLELVGLRHAVLIGDECQLPACVKSKVSQEAMLGRSLFQRLSSLGHKKHLLNIQYRMHPSISLFPNSMFYDNRISNGPNVVMKSYTKQYLPGAIFGSYSFIDVGSGRELSDATGRSKRNNAEVSVVMRIVERLSKGLHLLF